MLVKIFKTLETFEDLEIEASTIKEILMHLKATKGVEFTDALITSKYKYVLIDSKDVLKPLGLKPEVIFTAIGDYDTLYILPEVLGAVTGLAVLAFAGTAGGFGLATATVIAFAINVVAAIAIAAIVSLLVPTPEFGSDPSQAQTKQSALFNGAPLIREQGGSVPLVYGNPYAGGVLISSGVTTEDVL